MKVGTFNKRNTIALIVLGGGALYSLYTNVLSSPGPTTVPVATAPAAAPAPTEPDDGPTPRARARSEEWHPVVHAKNKEDQVDTSKIDPTLRLDLLAKVQASKPAGGDRNLFEFGAEKPKVAALPAHAEPIIQVATMGPKPLPPPPPPPGPPQPPPLPPLDAKYYGFATPSHAGRRRGFFMEGEDILIRAEGEMLVGRYKIVKLDAASVVVEDLDSKRMRTLQMAEDATN